MSRHAGPPRRDGQPPTPIAENGQPLSIAGGAFLQRANRPLHAARAQIRVADRGAQNWDDRCARASAQLRQSRSAESAVPRERSDHYHGTHRP